MTMPTRAQLDLAKTLGIDVPEGISKSQLTELIQLEKTRREQERTGTYNLPLESAAVVANDIEPVISVSVGRTLTNVATKIREAGIKPGCVIRVEGDKRLYYVYSITAKKMRLVAVDLSRVSGEITPTRFPSADLRISLVFAPPDGFQPAACFIPHGTPLSKERIQHLIGMKRPGLSADDIITTEQGEFWRFRQAA